MFCSHCATQLPDEALFCHKCAKPTAINQKTVSEFSTVSRMPPATAQPKKSYQSNWILRTSLSFFVIVVFGFAAFIIIIVLLNSGLSGIGRRNDPVTNTSIPESASTHHSENSPKEVIDETFHVNGLQMKYYEFTFNQNVNLVGKFSAQGGNNDIDCLIVDEDNFENVKNNTAGGAIFHSGYTSRGKVNLNLAPGHYVIVFDNRKALMTSKTVTAYFSTNSTN